MMGTILQLLISGIAMGFIYALVAIEYTLIWNSTGLLNFSHDKIITVGAYIFAATFIIKFNMNKPLAIVLTFMLMGILGSVIASGIFNPAAAYAFQYLCCHGNHDVRQDSGRGHPAYIRTGSLHH
ncbi:MAG: ABC transporter permease subunit [Enterocloster bolteae]